MPKFAHISDVHLGGWKQEPLQDLNFQSFQKAVDICIQSKLDFVIIVGDLFDTAYPSIEILKKTFAEFKKLRDAGLPCFIVAGSHDYSVSGKTFLDVLEHAGFCKNIHNAELRNKEDPENSEIILTPHIHKGVALYGYPGKKSGLEIPELRRVKLNDAPGMFKILMLHTSIDKAIGTLPIDSIETSLLPKAHYYALGHLHIDFKHENFLYPGPIFPNNFQELEDLKYGSFYIVDTDSANLLQKINLQIKEPLPIKIQTTNAITATQQIISELDKHNLQDKIILLRVEGELEQGKNSDIKFQQIEQYCAEKGAYFTLRNTHNLKVKETELELAQDLDEKNTEEIEQQTIKQYSQENPSDFNTLIPQIMSSLSLEKQEGETTETFTKRLLEGSNKILKWE